MSGGLAAAAASDDSAATAALLKATELAVHHQSDTGKPKEAVAGGLPAEK